ncbi:MAG: exostosin domain-containing protein [Lacipirellulaceae bacterium]
MTTAIHFFGVRPDEPTIPLAAALGVGADLRFEGADEHRFDRLFAEASSAYRVANEAAADVWVYPHNYLRTPHEHEHAERARRAGKPCVFFQDADDATPCSPPYGVVWRESILASQQTPVERCLPAFSDDLARDVGGFRPRPLGATPSVGFCGFVGSPWRRAWYRLQRRGAKVLGLMLRASALRKLERASGVQTNFVRRDNFWGGSFSRFSGANADSRRRVREEYVENLLGSDYTLCLRGGGNFSYRLYETLSLGRIPLFVNTDCGMPFAAPNEGDVDWRKHVVWVERRELPRIGAILRDFHDALTPDSYEALQRSNRRLWEEYLEPVACYRRVIGQALGR